MKKLIVQHKFWFTTLLFLIASVISIYITGMICGHIWTFLGMYNDGRFHVMRMEGLYEAIKHGNNFPIVNMSFLGGFGYISNVFYSNLWLYPVAWLRLAGLSMADAFVIYYILLTFITFWTSFGAFYHVSHRYDKSLLFSFIYTLSTYRLFDMVRRFDIGETLTLVFLPIVLLGIYEIFYGDQKQWLFLTAGMVAVIYSHALSPILIVIFMLWVILFRLKTLLKEPTRIRSLIYAGFTSLMLTLAYFLPIYEQTKHTQFKLSNPSIHISQTGMALKDLVNWSVHNDFYVQNIGILMLLIAVLIPFTIWKVKNAAVRDFAIIGEILLFMTTKYFPWKVFENTPLKMIQFPWRLNMLIMILFAVFLASDAGNWFNSGWKISLMMALTLGLVMVSEVQLIQNHPDEYSSYTAFDDLDTDSIGGGEEYLPKNASMDELLKTPHHPVVMSGSAEIKHFQQNQSQVTFQFKNAQAAKVSIPVIAYYGYSDMKSTGDVSKLTMDTKNNGLGLVKLNGTGTVRVNYYPTFIQKISTLISIISLMILIVFRFKIRKKE